MQAMILAICFTMITAKVLLITAENATQMENEKPWLVAFTAPWCGHCKRLAPVWEELSEELQGHTVVAKVNGDESMDLVARFGVSGYPTIVHIDSNEKVRVFGGSRSKDSLLSFARGGYAKLTPMSFWESPFSVVGLGIKWLVQVGVWLHAVKAYLVSEHALPVPILLFCGLAGLLFTSFLLALCVVSVIGCCQETSKRKAE